MSYENAPATKMLATHCACCARPLVDATSVEVGVGPECRKKHGFDKPDVEVELASACALAATLPADVYAEVAGAGSTREACNRLVYRIAAEQDGPLVNAMTDAVRALGFVRLALRIVARVATVLIDRQGESIVVRSPYSESALPILRAVPGRRFEKLGANGKKDPRNVFPATSAKPLLAALAKAFPGATACGPKGLFVLGSVAA
jgi:hypothetical protein